MSFELPSRTNTLLRIIKRILRVKSLKSPTGYDFSLNFDKSVAKLRASWASYPNPRKVGAAYLFDSLPSQVCLEACMQEKSHLEDPSLISVLYYCLRVDRVLKTSCQTRSAELLFHGFLPCLFFSLGDTFKRRRTPEHPTKLQEQVRSAPACYVSHALCRVCRMSYLESRATADV